MNREAAEVRKMRDSYQESLNSLEVDLRQLVAEIETLEEIRDRYVHVPGNAGEAKSPSWRNLNRQQATLRALTELGTPSRIPQIVEYLKSVGRFDDSVNLISAALSAMKRKGQVESHSRGLWQLAGTYNHPTALMTVVNAATYGDPRESG